MTIQPQIITREQAAARGLRHYFTGRTCCHGHITWRFVVNGNCQACNKLFVAQSRPQSMSVGM